MRSAIDIKPGLLSIFQNAKQVVLDRAAAGANGRDEEVVALISIPARHAIRIAHVLQRIVSCPVAESWNELICKKWDGAKVRILEFDFYQVVLEAELEVASPPGGLMVEISATQKAVLLAGKVQTISDLSFQVSTPINAAREQDRPIVLPCFAEPELPVSVTLCSHHLVAPRNSGPRRYVYSASLRRQNGSQLIPCSGERIPCSDE